MQFNRLQNRERYRQKYEQALKMFEENGCKLLSKTCPNQRHEVEFICVCGNYYRKTWGNFRKTPHCNKCKGISIDKIKKIYTRNKCVLLDEIKSMVRQYEYRFICKCKNEDIKSIVQFSKSPRCHKCDDKLYLLYIETRFLNKGCKLLDGEKLLAGTKYLTDPTPLSYVCSCGNIGIKKLYNFLRNPRCDHCISIIREKIGISKRLPFDEVKSFFQSKTFTILIDESEYKGVSYPILSLCSKEHICKVYYQLLKVGWGCCSICGIDTKKNTLMSKYGVDCVFKSKKLMEKMLERRVITWLKKYGVENPMHNPYIFEKSITNSFRYKKYVFPSGNLTYYQGYENFCLDDLLQKYDECEIYNRRIDVPIIRYFYDNKYRVYYPDMYIPSEHKIIEVKSEYTYQKEINKNKAKGKACIEEGYNFEIRIYGRDGKLIRTIDF